MQKKTTWLEKIPDDIIAYDIMTELVVSEVLILFHVFLIRKLFTQTIRLE